MAAGVERVAAGDLSRDIPGGGSDELAELARAANAMRRHLHQLVAEVESNAVAVHRAAQEIAQAVDGQAANSTEMSASVAEITSTMEELSASSTQIAEYSESVVEVARRTFDDSREGAQAMQQLVARMADDPRRQPARARRDRRPGAASPRRSPGSWRSSTRWPTRPS